MYGTRVAVLAGDFLFAQSSWFLANLDNLEVIKLISQVIADFANGEISQAASLFDTDVTLQVRLRLLGWGVWWCYAQRPAHAVKQHTRVLLQAYLDKSFYKTASLIAASCRSAAVFSDCTPEVKEAMFAYGKHLGLAFQVREGTRCACVLLVAHAVSTPAPTLAS
jgi:all-trans-nonaprenyl-diphosphate synthase